jgi:hypothetical protein
MKKIVLVLCSLLVAGAAHSQVIGVGGGSSSAAPVSVATLVAAPVAVTPSDSVTFTPGTKGMKFTVTVPGNIKFGFPNGVTWTDSFPAAGVYQYPWGANQIFVTGTTATFSAWTF